MKSRLRNRDLYQEFLKCLHIYNSDVVSKMELRGLVYDVLGKYPDLLAGFDDFLQKCESMDFDTADAGRGKLTSKDVAKMKIISAREKFLSRPISELDLSMCERCGPSYRLLPKGFPKAPTSGRTDLHASVLNDAWVSVTSGSEDFSFKARKNQYEEALFRCEDDRFELDMVIETNAAALRALLPVAAAIEALSIDDRAAFKLGMTALSPVHTRAVERVYAEHGPEVRVQLLRAPAAVVPVVITRLAQKDAEWRRVRDEMRRVWADVYEKNFSKSLDHRSFLFKAADKKAISAKGMLVEIKELSDKRRANEETPMGGAGAPAGRRRDLSVDMCFSYTDRAVHDDVYAVIKFSSGEMCSDDAARQLVAFWRSFVEPFFCVSRPADGTDGYVDPVAECAATWVAREAREEAKDRADGGRIRPVVAPGHAPDAGKEEAKPYKTAGLAAAVADDDDAVDDTSHGRNRTVDRLHDACADKSGSDDETSRGGRPLSGCRPLASAPPCGPSKACGRVFYGHESVYLLFRLHRHLYERLASARAAAAARPDATWAPLDASVSETSTHALFMRLLFRLLSGSVEPSRYEDECRALLGANSFVLSTLDKLVYKLMKQVQALLADDTVGRLLLLHGYEGARLVVPRDDAQYAANAGVLLHDEPCFRIAAGDDTTLTVLMQEACVGDKGVDSVFTDARFSEYLRDYLNTSAPVGQSGAQSCAQGAVTSRLFLARCITLQPVSITCVNGLECKLACATSKVSYVLDTEDVLRVRRGVPPYTGGPRSPARFHDWLARRLTAPALA